MTITRAPSMTRTRRVLLGVASAVAALPLSACALGAPQGERAPARGPALSPLLFWGSPNSEMRQAQVRSWNDRNPTRVVTYQNVHAVGAGVEALRAFAAQVAAGTAPHVVDFDRFQVAAYANWKMLGELDGYAKRDGLNLALFTPAALAEASGLDRRLYGLPSSVDVRLLYWNRREFADAGLDPETPPASWDDLAVAARRLTRRGATSLDRMGFHTQEGQSSLHTFAWQNGGGFVTADGKRATLARPENEAALTHLVTLMNDQAEWAATKSFRDSWSQEAAGHPFLTGRLAMHYQVNQWAGEVIARHQAGLAFGVAAPPPRRAGDKPLTWSGGYSYVMSRNVRDADAGWALIRDLVSEASWVAAFDAGALAARASGGQFQPGMTGQPALDKKMFARYRTGIPDVDRVPEVALEVMQHTRNRDQSIAAADLWDGITHAQQDAVSGAMSATAALQAQNSLVQRALDQAWVFAPAR